MFKTYTRDKVVETLNYILAEDLTRGGDSLEEILKDTLDRVRAALPGLPRELLLEAHTWWKENDLRDLLTMVEAEISQPRSSDLKDRVIKAALKGRPVFPTYTCDQVVDTLNRLVGEDLCGQAADAFDRLVAEDFVAGPAEDFFAGRPVNLDSLFARLDAALPGLPRALRREAMAQWKRETQREILEVTDISQMPRA